MILYHKLPYLPSYIRKSVSYTHLVKGTILFEGLGAILLSIRFIPEMGFKVGIYNAVFHAISAFCNAGFDLMGRFKQFSFLTRYSDDIIVNITIMSLIVIGGIGFLVRCV